jgi:hypothetical protein
MPSTKRLLVAFGAIKVGDTGQLDGSVVLDPFASHQLSSSFQGPTSVTSTLAIFFVPFAKVIVNVQLVDVSCGE